MGRKSSISPEIRAAFEQILIRENATIDDLHALAVSLGADVSRSAVGRTAKDISAVAAEIRRMREMARGWAAELGTEDATESHESLVQVLHTMALKWSAENVQKDGGQIPPLEIERMSKAVRNLMATTMDRTAFAAQIRKEERENAVKVAKDAGADLAILEKIKAIYRGEA